MRKIIGLLFFGIFLTGCYANSLTMVGPATGVASGKLSETATSTTINNVEAVFKSLSNQISKEDFHFIGNRSLVKYEKPNPEIYKLTLEKLNLEPDNCLAIEDTEESSKSALSAGIKCIGFPGDYHSDDSFEMCIKKVKIL